MQRFKIPGPKVSALSVVNEYLPKDDSLKAKYKCLIPLGNGFLHHFEHLGGLVDMNGAIVAHKQAVSITPGGHVDRLTYLNNLEVSFESQFEHLGGLVSLDETMRRAQVSSLSDAKSQT